MRRVRVLVNDIDAGILEELPNSHYCFSYDMNYQGSPVSLTMPTTKQTYEFKAFPPFFEGLLPEGAQLEALLRRYKIDRNDMLGQLIQVGADVVGAVTIEEVS